MTTLLDEPRRSAGSDDPFPLPGNKGASGNAKGVSDGQALHDLEFNTLQARLKSDGVAGVHAAPLWRWLYADSLATAAPGDPLASRAFPPPLERWWQRSVAPGGPYFLDAPSVVREVASTDQQTRKFLLQLRDGATIETVLMGYPGRFTACLSTQVGCAMGCTFCATGQGGFGRHLRPGEIVAQVLHVQRQLRARGHSGLRNLVLMGMGEPLHNYDSLLTALRILGDRHGLSLGPRRTTISTVGVVPGILRLAEEPEPFNLAVSLHAATQDERARLIPVARRWPLDTLMDACRTYAQRTGRRIFFEWTLIDGQNDSPALARQVADLLQGLDAHVNLIPLNPTAEYSGRASSPAAAAAFQAVLQRAGFRSTVRQRRGIDVAAGCGQLAG